MILLAAFFALWRRFVRWCWEKVLPSDALRLGRDPLGPLAIPPEPIRSWGLDPPEREN